MYIYISTPAAWGRTQGYCYFNRRGGWFGDKEHFLSILETEILPLQQWSRLIFVTCVMAQPREPDFTSEPLPFTPLSWIFICWLGRLIWHCGGVFTPDTVPFTKTHKKKTKIIQKCTFLVAWKLTFWRGNMLKIHIKNSVNGMLSTYWNVINIMFCVFVTWYFLRFYLSVFFNELHVDFFLFNFIL